MAKSTWADGDTFHAADQNAIATEVTSDTSAISAIAAVNGFIKGNGAGAYSAGTTFTGSITGASIGTSTINSSSWNGGTINTPTIAGYTEANQILGTVTTTKTIGALSGGTFVTATLTASTGCTFTMPTAAAGQSFTLLLKQPSTGGNGTAVFTGVKWPGSVAPTITPTAGQLDILTFVSDGTNWYGSYTQGYTY